MSRLIAFGCSFTYGQGLPDCRGNAPFNSPSNFSWPVLLGNLLGRSVINKGTPGSSNAEILFNVLNFDFKKDDLVVLMWTVPNRDLYFSPDRKTKKPYTQLGPWAWGHSMFTNYWLKNINEKDNKIKSWFHMHHADLYLKSKNIKYIHYPSFPQQLDIAKPEFLKLSNYFKDGFRVLDQCENDKHPGIESHKDTAHCIFKRLNEL